MYPIGQDNGLREVWAVQYARPDGGQKMQKSMDALQKPWMHFYLSR
jgi:hypothetical protein